MLNLAGASLLVPVAGLLLHVVHRDGLHVVTFGGWPAPFGIIFVAYLFSAVLVALTSPVAGHLLARATLLLQETKPSQLHFSEHPTVTTTADKKRKRAR